MKLSEQRLDHFAHLIVDSIWDDDLVDYTDEDMALRMAKQAVHQWAKDYDNLDEVVRNKIASLKRNVPEGTSEWDILYHKYLEEETNRRG